MRLIDADALLDLIHDSTILTDGFVSTMTALIAGEPTIYPEWTDIVKCKDCKYGSPNGEYGCRVYHFKLYEKHEMNADDFCSRAERREE